LTTPRRMSSSLRSRCWHQHDPLEGCERVVRMPRGESPPHRSAGERPAPSPLAAARLIPEATIRNYRIVRTGKGHPKSTP
jgi:hypothetical protein